MLNVGDGACSVVRERFGEHDPRNHTAIIDCGGNSAEDAALTLEHQMLPADWRSLSELVVTHFDADHWRGLWLIAECAPLGFGFSHGLMPELPIYFPAVPFNADRRLPASLSAFITATGPFGVQAIDLQTSWRRLTSVKLVPRAKDDSLSLAGRLHEVVWPPRHLNERSTQRLNKLVQRIDAEANRLAEEGYPQLKSSLRATYQNGPHNRHPGEVTVADLDFGQSGPGAGEGMAELRDPRLADSPGPAIPREWARRDDFRKLVKAARRAQNDLSLVFHDPELASLLVYGDAPRRIVERLSGELGARYQVALAPHHGSHKVPGNIPAAETCVSQQGRRRGRDWPNHLGSHANNGKCVHTREHEVNRVLR